MNRDKRRSIRRGVAVVLTAAGALGSSGGCFGKKKVDVEEREPFTQQVWREQARISEERLKSEDERGGRGVMGPIDRTTDALWDQVLRIYYWISGDTPFDAAKNMVDPGFPDKRRQAIMFFSKHEYGRREPYTKYYAEMARTDDHHIVRAMAIRAMNRARVRDQTALYVAAMDDKHPLVRLEAVKALAQVPDAAAAVPGLIRRMQDPEETTDVRVAAADALRLHKTSEVAQALVRVLRDREFGVAWQARQSLRLMTGKDYRFDPAAWLTYLTGTGNPFV